MITVGPRKRARVILFLALAGSILFSAAASGAVDAVPGEFVVQLKKPRDSYDATGLASALGAKVMRDVRPDIIVVVRDPKESREKALRSLRRSGLVLIAEPNAYFHHTRVPNDPEMKRLWGLRNMGNIDKEGTLGIKGVDIGAERAWDMTVGSKSVVVAVIDTGVDFAIPDLKENAWVNQAEATGQAGMDDDGNGYVDDINGFNFVANTGDPKDDHGHGSHCAGTIGARGDDGVGVAGVAWEVSIMAVKFLDDSGTGTLENSIKAIDYARKNRAHVLSNSWGGNLNSDLLKKAIRDSRDAGQLFVAASGNSGLDSDRSPQFPAGFDIENVFSIAAVDNRGELAYFSNFGARSVHVAAPGVNVLSTIPGGLDVYSGTSMATPHVSGIAALLLAHDPSLTYAQLKTRIMETARPIRGLKGKTKSGGMADAYYALTATKPPPDPNDPSVWKKSAPYALSSEHPYKNNVDQTFTVHMPGARRIAVHFSRFEMERGYDRVRFMNDQGASLGSLTGNQNDRFSPIVEGDKLILKFTTDGSVTGHGWDIDKIVFEQ